MQLLTALILYVTVTVGLPLTTAYGHSGNGGTTISNTTHSNSSSSSSDSSDSSDSSNGIIYLSNTDFENGTVIITESDVRVELVEDIIFNPNSDYIDSPNEEGAYFCLPQDINIFPGCDKTPGSFRLGFFAAISLEADDIIFDLNGYSMSVSNEFHLQQRFFCLISVGKGPFINGQGPSTFGSDISVKNIEITNGHLGLSAHHGIHGNFIENIEIYDLTINNFEVAGIQLNGFEDAYIHDVDIGPSLCNVPTRGRYSQARFGLLSFREMKQRLEQLSLSELESSYSIEFIDRPGESMTAVEVIERLILGMDLFFDYKINGNFPALGTSNYNLLEEAIDTFDNEFGDPDGSALYGIVLNSAGVAVDWFGSASTTYSESVEIENVNIHDLNIRVSEIIPYRTSAGPHATGPFKGSLPMEPLLNLYDKNPITFDLAQDSVNNYNGNMLSDAQIVLALYGNGSTELEGNTIDDEIIGWSQGFNALSNGSLVCNGDDMFHMNKGVIGIRIDRTDGIEIKNVNIRNINNWSPLGSLFCNIYNESNQTNSFNTHPTTPSASDNGGTNYKFQGRVSRGIALTDVEGDIEIKDIVISDIVSAKGSAIGIDLLGSTQFNVELDDNIIINDILSCNELSDSDAELLTTVKSFPNNNVISCALLDTNGLADFEEQSGSDLDINDIEGPSVCIESLSSTL